MKNTGKVSLFYVLTVLGLFVVLLGGGAYGIYLSVGLSFVRSSVPEFSEIGGGATNVSIAGTANYTQSMTGIILLSVFLIVLAIVDFVIMIKQVVFFKQFKIIKNSKLEKKIEQKTKSKSSVIFWSFVFDIVTFLTGIAGLFVNNRSFAESGNYSWIFYAVDIAVSVLSLLSIILLVVKLKQKKNMVQNNSKNRKTSNKRGGQDIEREKEPARRLEPSDINQMEYNLIKLEAMKKGKLIKDEEYNKIRKKIIKFDKRKDVIDE